MKSQLTLGQFVHTPRQHLRLLNQRRRNRIHRDSLLRIRIRKPMHEPMQRALGARIVRADDAARDARHAAHEDDAAPALAFHGRHAQLREQVRRAAVYAPGLLEGVHGDGVDGGNTAVGGGSPGVVDEDIWGSEQ